MMNIEEMKIKNGYFVKDGKTYVLLQQAYLSTRYNEPAYVYDLPVYLVSWLPPFFICMVFCHDCYNANDGRIA